MRMRTLGLVVVLPVLLAGCGDQRTPSDGATPSTLASRCVPTAGAGSPGTRADLDGDGRPERVDYLSSSPCPGGPLLTATVDDLPVAAELADDLPVAPGGIAAIRVPGRKGDLVLVEQQHPRGGFQARLFGYAGGRLAELTVEGRPLFEFIATDVLTTPTAATCADHGFVVTQARAHEPVGVMAAWDVFRTTYTVDGNAVTKGATTEIADNVLDAELRRRYGDLVDHDFFADCRVRL